MRVKLWFTNGMCNGKVQEVMEVPDDEVEDMDEKEREEYLSQCAYDFMNNHVDFGFEVLDD